MRKYGFLELINIESLKKMAENIYNVAGIPIGIIGVDGTIYIKTGWQDICTKYHRIHPVTCEQCFTSDQYINEHLRDGEYISYKCLNNMWDIAVPIIITGEHMATIFLGQFFYEDEAVDIEYFRNQALEFGFDEKEYLDALKKVPVYSKKKVEQIMDYYLGLVQTLAESSRRQIECEATKKELEKSQVYLNTIFNSVNDAIFLHDINGNIIDVNETVTSMFGYSRNELINMNINNIVYQSAEHKKFNMEELVNGARNINPLILEYIVKNKSNKEFWVEVNIRITMINNEERIVATVRDITERKQAEITLQNENLELEKLRTEFFANISHELRTPLNIILSSIQINEMILKNEQKTKTIDNEKIINNINIERQNCLRLQRLINNIIDLTKLDSGNFELNMINCNIVSIVEEITLSVAKYINGNNLIIIFDTEIEEKIIACDLDKIERIMLNILSNSVKFSRPGGSILVNIFDGEEYIAISIEDNGIGIPKDKLSIIFDRFRQVDKSFTRNYEGSGIGLSLAKSMVEMQGGTISAVSEYGVGTKMILKLPIRVLDYNNSKKSTELTDETINNHLERIEVEFSDICLNNIS